MFLSESYQKQIVIQRDKIKSRHNTMKCQSYITILSMLFKPDHTDIDFSDHIKG